MNYLLITSRGILSSIRDQRTKARKQLKVCETREVIYIYPSGHIIPYSTSVLGHAIDCGHSIKFHNYR